MGTLKAVQSTRMSVRVQRQLPFALVGTALVVAVPALVAALLPRRPARRRARLRRPERRDLARPPARCGGGSPQSRDVLFADLMLWGWMRRLRTERRLEHVETFVLHRGGGPVEAIRCLRGLQRVTAMLENRDAYTRRHSHRVTRHCEGIARELGLPDGGDRPHPHRRRRCTTSASSSRRARSSTSRAGSPRRSSPSSSAIPGDGADMVDGVVDPEVVAMIRHHHERLGGTGYPDGLVGDAIPLGARIIAVADTFDAMTSTRAYRIRPAARQRAPGAARGGRHRRWTRRSSTPSSPTTTAAARARWSSLASALPARRRPRCAS